MRRAGATSTAVQERARVIVPLAPRRPVTVRWPPQAAALVGDDPIPAAHRCYAATGDPEVLATLVEHYGGYAAVLARKLHRGREPLEDLVQVANEGLLLALRRYDPDRGVPFTGFATPTILGTIRRFFRDHGYGMQVPRSAQELAGPARAAAERLCQELGRPPTVPEVATALGVDEEDLLHALSALDARHPASLDAPRPAPQEPLAAVVGCLDPDLRRVEDSVALGQGLATLDDRDREVLTLYFREELTQSEIAARFGVSQVQVSRWIASAVRRLRARFLG